MTWLIVAAVTTAIIAALHSYLGERLIMPQLLRSENLPRLRGKVEVTRLILRWAWHLTSLAWVGFAVQLSVLAWVPPAARLLLGAVIVACLGLSGLVVFAITRGRHPVWPLFALAATAAWLGSRSMP